MYMTQTISDGELLLPKSIGPDTQFKIDSVISIFKLRMSMCELLLIFSYFCLVQMLLGMFSHLEKRAFLFNWYCTRPT